MRSWLCKCCWPKATCTAPLESKQPHWVLWHPRGWWALESFAKIQRRQKTFMLWALGRKDLVIKVPAFTGLFWDFCIRTVTSYTIMTITARLSMVRKLMRTSSWQKLDPKWMVLSSSSAPPSLSGWMASRWSLARQMRTGILWDPWSSLGPGMARTAKRSPLLTVDKSNKSD